MKFALAQINPTVGNLEENLNKILHVIEAAGRQGTDVIIFPELALCGYPPKDLLLKKQFIQDNKKYLNILKDKTPSQITVAVGFPEENSTEGKPLFNSVAIIQDKKIIATRQKTLLPTYDVFDEDRYFEPAKEIKIIELFNKKIGITVCEDIWHDDLSWTKPRYHLDPATELKKQKTDLIINLSSSPYFIGKPKLRLDVLKNCAKKHKTPLIYVNQAGGNDELIFDGNSCVIDKDGNLCLGLKSFEEDLQIINLDHLPSPISHLLSQIEEEELLQAIICGLRDYVKKCNFKKVLIGISGGVDSALVAVLAVMALGAKNVSGVFMPSRYTSDESTKDAKQLAENLSIELKTIPIEEPYMAFLNLLEPVWANKDKVQNISTAKENIQARIRGLILMALSNQSGALLLSTGNKSEIATGYCTLYGDMCGGLAVISDLPKTEIYKLAKYVNVKHKTQIEALIPYNILTKEPTAELKPNQRDQDVLPPYDLLDHVLNAYVEEHKPLAEIIKNGVPRDLALKTCTMIDKSEYKRQQAAPGLKLTNRSFGYGWRMPVAQGYREQV